MRFGYWLPVWLRNVDDEQMDASWSYARTLAQNRTPQRIWASR